MVTTGPVKPYIFVSAVNDHSYKIPCKIKKGAINPGTIPTYLHYYLREHAGLQCKSALKHQKKTMQMHIFIIKFVVNNMKRKDRLNGQGNSFITLIIYSAHSLSRHPVLLHHARILSGCVSSFTTAGCGKAGTTR